MTKRGEIMLAPILWALNLVERFVFYSGRVLAHARMRRLFPGKRVICDYSTIIKYPEQIDIGDDVWLGSSVSLGAYAGLTLEDRVRISHGAFIETASLDLGGEVPYEHKGKPVRIGFGTWIGAYAIVLGGVTIGRQAVVAAGAVVVRDVPDNAIVAGIPARVVGYRPGHEPQAPADQSLA
jgi:acetyltransferase-like isoleucine patch superfamily enzyme